MIESTRSGDAQQTVVLVHPLGRRFATSVPTPSMEVASVLDAVGIVAGGTSDHRVRAVVVERSQLQRFPDAATAIKQLDGRVRVVAIVREEGGATDAEDSFDDIDVSLSDITAASLVADAVAGSFAPTGALAGPAPGGPGPESPAPDDSGSHGVPGSPSDVVGEDERRALSEPPMFESPDPTSPDRPATRSPDVIEWPGRPGAGDADPDAEMPRRSTAGQTPPAGEWDAGTSPAEGRRAWPEWPEDMPEPEGSAGEAAGDHPRDSDIHVGGATGRATSEADTGRDSESEAPPPLSFAEAVRARESEFDADASRDGRESLGDVDLVEAVLAGGGRIGPTAVQLIREQTDWRDLQLHALDPGDEVPAETSRAAVVDGSRRFGVLTSEVAPPDELELWAGWLSRWLELGRRHELYHAQARSDELTGAANRRAMMSFLDEVLLAARVRRRPVTVMVFDIDDFKRFNDEHGHEAGDTILRETVALLRSVTRRSDLVCRIGGDEFAVIFTDLEGPRTAGSSMLDDVEVIARRFQSQVTAMRFPRLGMDAPGMLSISAGLATFPWDGTEASALLRVADHRAMESKRRGKNHITFGPGVMFADESADPAGTR